MAIAFSHNVFLIKRMAIPKMYVRAMANIRDKAYVTVKGSPPDLKRKNPFCSLEWFYSSFYPLVPLPGRGTTLRKGNNQEGYLKK